jgi:hypothetical protein
MTSPEDKEWIEREFKRMASIFEKSWVYQETVEKSKREGREEELCNMLIRLTTLRFPDLVNQAQKQAEQTKSQEQLRTMIDKLFTATTNQEARDALMS